MNYYDARLRQNSERWDYTCRNDDRIWPLGYCALPQDDEHACGGHATAEEARKCFARWMRDQPRREFEASNWGDCAVCGEPAKHCVQAAYPMVHVWRLCEKHNNAEALAELMPDDAGQMISSY